MIFVVDPERDFGGAVTDLVGARVVVRHVERPEDLEGSLRPDEGTPDAVIFGPNLTHEDALKGARRIQDLVPGVGTVMVSRDVSPELLRSALRSGLQDVLEYPLSPGQLQEAVDVAREHSRQAWPDQRVGARTDTNRLITVFSTKGGCGKSFTASNLAVVLAEKIGQEVALVDLDLQSGDLAIMLQMMPAWTITDAAEDPDRLDIDALRGYLVEHRSGVRLLAAPAEPSQADNVSPEAVQQILRMLQSEFRYTVVDGPALFTEQMLTSLDESQRIVLVTSMDVPSIKNLRLALDTLRRLGHDRDQISLVLNRADSNVGLRLEEVEKAIGTEIDVSIPSSREVPLSVNQGTPITLEHRRSRSAIIDAFHQLAARIHEDDTDPRGGDDEESRLLFWRRK